MIVYENYNGNIGCDFSLLDYGIKKIDYIRVYNDPDYQNIKIADCTTGKGLLLEYENREELFVALKVMLEECDLFEMKIMDED